MPPIAALITHPACSHHDTGHAHPESRDRLRALLDAVRLDPALGGVLLEQVGRLATEEDLLRVHEPGHLANVKAAADEARRRAGLVWLDQDTPVSGGSWEAALAAAGCAIAAAEAVLDGSCDAAFALSRPPGHHATRGRAMGFCLFNNVAVAVRWAQTERHAGRVLVVDWDAHHGNGTQDIFFEDPTVYALSLHAAGAYPATGGGAGERGAGEGRGTTRNVPLPPGSGAAEYRRRYVEAIEAALAVFTPDMVFISAGFDLLASDPMGLLALDPADLHTLTEDLLTRIPAPARKRVVAVLEGGYALDRIGEALVNVLRAFTGLPRAP